MWHRWQRTFFKFYSFCGKVACTCEIFLRALLNIFCIALRSCHWTTTLCCQTVASRSPSTHHHTLLPQFGPTLFAWLCSFLKTNDYFSTLSHLLEHVGSHVFVWKRIETCSCQQSLWFFHQVHFQLCTFPSALVSGLPLPLGFWHFLLPFTCTWLWSYRQVQGRWQRARAAAGAWYGIPHKFW